MRFRLATVALIVGLSACSQTPTVRPTPGLSIVEDRALPGPSRADLTAPDRPSLIGPLDVISVEVFGAPELSKELQVDLSGRISLPLIGQIDARGKTSTELAAEVSSLLRGRYVKDPDVTINVKTSVSQVVTVDGEVTQPGLYPVTNQTTLVRAVASAKGLSDFARIDDVIVLRTVNNRRMAGLYNLGAIRRGVYEDPPVFANDIVIVGDSPTRRLFRDIISTAPLLAAPIVAIIQ